MSIYSASETIDLERVVSRLAKGPTPQELVGISDEMLDKCYQFACSALEQKKYCDAADMFLVIAMLNPFVSDFWLRLGNAEAGKQDYESALEAYSMAMMYDADDPYPHLYAAEIYHHQHRFDTALHCLAIGKLLIEEAEEGFESLIQYIDKEQRVIDEKKKKTSEEK